MVAEVRPNYDSDWAAITAAAEKLGIGTTETLRKWVRRAEVDAATGVPGPAVMRGWPRRSAGSTPPPTASTAPGRCGWR
jgi:transposase-like protein